MDAVRAGQGLVPYRCRDCRIRFYAASSAQPPAGHRRHRRAVRSFWKRRKRAIVNSAIFLLVLGVFAICLDYMANDHLERPTSRMSVAEVQKVTVLVARRDITTPASASGASIAARRATSVRSHPANTPRGTLHRTHGECAKSLCQRRGSIFPERKDRSARESQAENAHAQFLVRGIVW